MNQNRDVTRERLHSASVYNASVPEGLSCGGLREAASSIEADIASGLYSGAVLLVTRAGQMPWVFTTGGVEPGGASLRPDSVFTLYSISKVFTNALIFQCIDRGQIALTTPVSEVIPEFSGDRRALITIHHLLTHTAGLLPVFAPRVDMSIDRLDEVIDAICQRVQPLRSPGDVVWYSPMVAHALLGEIARRCDGMRRSFAQIAAEDLFDPLQMRDTSFGVRNDLRARHVPPVFGSSSPPMEYPGRPGLGRYGALVQENAEMPWLGAVSTVGDLLRFAEMLRLGGSLGGERIISTALLDQARIIQTGDRVQEIYRAHCMKRGWKMWPANFGLGFQLRGTTPGHYYHAGSTAHPMTFYNVGLGTSVFWIEPVREVVCICLTTPVIGEAESIERFERLSDLVHAAIL